MRELEGKVAVITGAAGGFGRALCWELARSGMQLALADVDRSGLEALAGALRTEGHRALPVPTDVTDPRAIEALLARTLSELGSCHLMCNNAGVFTAAPLLSTSEAQWRRVIDVNLWGVIHGCRVFGAHFVKQREGHILNTASAAGLFPVPGMSSYSTTKFAVVGFSQQLRYELARDGVGVTVLCPGVLRTDMARAEGVGLEHLDIEQMVKGAATPEGLAKKAVRAIRRDRAMVIYGGEAALFRVLRLLPSWALDPFGRFAGKKGLEAVQKPDADGTRR